MCTASKILKHARRREKLFGKKLWRGTEVRSSRVIIVARVLEPQACNLKMTIS